ncbi:hypothetical protein MTX26_04235 [Bradyrhizobium sp. ISRA443]|uniref:hypothetical protein n=1 Tax=unclassified Bradyrhizobium TaxID=2631580 RepID=UPI00247A668A|nr:MULTISPECIES: hypothetical protein [unclassified Bradyrhizobium]WGR95156.1 hypothetical protein MTX20_14365 [Bradyrhizobium sp. ISRA435]WGS00075.1 hypothetical protein MTX23_04235 [Bradyrhizobium sp. ISRA436]WGS06964.1 hypothetical protein MTX18_04235 [Bradyrhizobium sp. ISRA437]WGS13846.1 hypothetical protein MTX26_04235 [Bradyrhizobium sp. ISRA443]
MLEAKHVDAEVIGRGALAVKRVDAAARAEEMFGVILVPLIRRQQIFTAEDLKLAFVRLRHDGVLSPAERAIASDQPLDRCVDLEGDRVAMT